MIPGFPMSCLTSEINPLPVANEISGVDAFAWQIISENGARLDSSGRVGIDPDLALGGTPNFGIWINGLGKIPHSWLATFFRWLQDWPLFQRE